MLKSWPRHRKLCTTALQEPYTARLQMKYARQILRRRRRHQNRPPRLLREDINILLRPWGTQGRPPVDHHSLHSFEPTPPGGKGELDTEDEAEEIDGEDSSSEPDLFDTFEDIERPDNEADGADGGHRPPGEEADNIQRRPHHCQEHNGEGVRLGTRLSS